MINKKKKMINWVVNDVTLGRLTGVFVFIPHPKSGALIPASSFRNSRRFHTR